MNTLADYLKSRYGREFSHDDARYWAKAYVQGARECVQGYEPYKSQSKQWQEGYDDGYSQEQFQEYHVGHRDGQRDCKEGNDYDVGNRTDDSYNRGYDDGWNGRKFPAALQAYIDYSLAF